MTTVVAKKKLAVSGSAAGVSVTKLAPGERVSVSEGKRLVAQGHADAKGVFRFIPKNLSAGKHKLVATGKLVGRTATKTFKISR